MNAHSPQLIRNSIARDLRIIPHPQLVKLEALIASATSALPYAARGEVFDTPAGAALTNAAFDLFESDELYDMALEQAEPFGGIAAVRRGDDKRGEAGE